MDQSEEDYRAPSLTEYGDVERITTGHADGSFTDRDFPDDTPRGDLTFSTG